MASFCTKCGAAISPDTQFCTGCGAPVTAAPADSPAPAWAAGPVSPAAPPPAAYAPTPMAAYPQPIAAPTSSGGSALKIILIIVAVFVGLGILGAGIFAFTVWRVARTIHVDGNGGQVTVNTPGGSISANSSQSYSASELGTEVYPGAESGHGGMKMDLPTGSMVEGIFLTTDSKDKVLDFYKSRFGSEASVMDTADGAVLTMTKGQQESVVVTITSKGSDGKTQIAIMHTKKK